MQLRSLSLLALIGCLGASDASSYWVRVMPGGWSVVPSGSIAYAKGSNEPSEFDLEELNVANREIAPMVDVSIRLPLLFDLNAGVHHYTTEGDSTLTRQFVFGGLTYSSSERVETDIDLLDAYLEALVRLPIPGDTVVAGVGLAAHYVRGDFQVTSQTTSQKERLTEDLVVPAVAGRIQVNLPFSIGLEADGHWLSVNTSKVDASFLDLRGQASWRPIPWIGIAAGYRYLTYGVAFSDENNNADVDLTFAGPFAELVAQF